MPPFKYPSFKKKKPVELPEQLIISRGYNNNTRVQYFTKYNTF